MRKLTKKEKRLVKKIINLKPKPFPKDCITRIYKTMPFKDRIVNTMCNFEKELIFRHQQDRKDFCLSTSDIYKKYANKITAIFWGNQRSK